MEISVDRVKQKAIELMNSKYKHVQTPSGMVYIIEKSSEVPAGFRKLTIGEGRELVTYLNTILDEWAVVGF